MLLYKPWSLFFHQIMPVTYGGEEEHVGCTDCARTIIQSARIELITHPSAGYYLDHLLSPPPHFLLSEFKWWMFKNNSPYFSDTQLIPAKKISSSLGKDVSFIARWPVSWCVPTAAFSFLQESHSLPERLYFRFFVYIHCSWDGIQLDFTKTGQMFEFRVWGAWQKPFKGVWVLTSLWHPDWSRVVFLSPKDFFNYIII